MEKEILKNLDDIELMLKRLVKLELFDVLSRETADPKFWRIYEMTGNFTVIQISEETGIATGSISGIWQRWEKIGLLEKDGKSYRKIV